MFDPVFVCILIIFPNEEYIVDISIPYFGFEWETIEEFSSSCLIKRFAYDGATFSLIMFSNLKTLTNK